jgi:peptide/nickel transport system permease protein
MIGYLLRRVGGSLVLLFLLLTFTFFLIHLAPGDPANLLLDPKTPEPIREQLRHLWGLDQPLGQQYLTWLGAILRGDWGTSLNYQEPVTRILARAFPNTLVLAVTAALVAFGLGIPLGLWAARRQNELPDHALRIVTFLLYSLPTFWLAVMAILLFSYVVPVLPAGQMHSVGADRLPTVHRALDLLYHLVLPATVLGASFAGAITRFVRNSLLETLDQDYLRTARAKGLSERRVLWVHALRNALVPVVQLLGLQLPALLNGSLVTEVVFSWPGLGRIAFIAVQARDYPLILATTALSGTLVVLGNLMADLLHAATDPRIRDG